MNQLDRFLEKIGIISYFDIELPLSAYEFASRLGSITQYGDLGLFSDLEDIFSSDVRKIKGLVVNNNFKIKHKKEFFDFGKHVAFINGFVNESPTGIKISVKVNSFKTIHLVFLILICLYLFFATLSVLYSVVFEDPMAFIVFPFLILFALITLGIPYLFLKNSTNKMQDFFKGQFYYLAN